jgi:hypothetical protein
MYDLGDLRHIMKLRLEGYDYVVLPFCILSFKTKLRLYMLLAPLIAGSCLLKKGSILISTNFITYSTQYLNI